MTAGKEEKKKKISECDSKEWRGKELQHSRGDWEGLGFPGSGSCTVLWISIQDRNDRFQ